MLAILDETQSQEQGLTLQKVTHSGGVFIAMFGEAEELLFQKDSDVSGEGALIHTSALKLNQKIYGSLQPLELYNSNAPFSHQRWVLVGLESQNALYGFSHKAEQHPDLYDFIHAGGVSRDDVCELPAIPADRRAGA